MLELPLPFLPLPRPFRCKMSGRAWTTATSQVPSAASRSPRIKPRTSTLNCVLPRCRILIRTLFLFMSGCSPGNAPASRNSRRQRRRRASLSAPIQQRSVHAAPLAQCQRWARSVTASAPRSHVHAGAERTAVFVAATSRQTCGVLTPFRQPLALRSNPRRSACGNWRIRVGHLLPSPCASASSVCQEPWAITSSGTNIHHETERRRTHLLQRQRHKRRETG